MILTERHSRVVRIVISCGLLLCFASVTALGRSRLITSPQQSRLSLKLVRMALLYLKAQEQTPKLCSELTPLRDKLLAAGIGGIKHSELSKHLQRYMDAEHTRTALDVMHELGMVQRFENVTTGRGRPTTIWRAKQGLVSTGALDTILNNLAPTS